MANPKHGTKNNVGASANAPVRILTRGVLCNCGGQRTSVVNCTVPKKAPHELTKNGVVNREDLRGLMQILSARNGGGAKVDIDSEGNLVWKKQGMATSYGGGVGRIGRIDEDKTCSFEEVDVNKLRFYSRSGSNATIIRS